MKMSIPFFVFSIFFCSNSLLAQTQDLDAYGGLRAKHFEDGEGNGFFRTKYNNGQWWLVTPHNNAFLAFGLNHFHSNLWKKEYNKKHWEDEFRAKTGSDIWARGFYNHAADIVKAIGANSMGYHNEEKILLERKPLLPYIRQYIPVKISLHMRAKAEAYIDVFAPEFKEICDKAALKQVAPYVKDTMIIGFAMADIPVLTENWAKVFAKNRKIPTWAMVLRNLPASSPGKQKYLKTMQDNYISIKDFNQVYGTDFSSWKALEDAENWRETTDFENAKEVEDNNAFNKLCMKKYYEVALASFRAIDKNHLFFGDKLNANLRDKTELDLVVDVAKDYVDVIFFQFYGKDNYQKDIQNKIAELSNLPMMNGDGGFGAYGDSKMPKPQSPTAKNQLQRASWMYEYAKNAFEHPHFVGWHICGVIDAWRISSSGRQKPGIMNPLGKYHMQVIDTLSALSAKIYSFRMN